MSMKGSSIFFHNGTEPTFMALSPYFFSRDEASAAVNPLVVDFSSVRVLSIVCW